MKKSLLVILVVAVVVIASIIGAFAFLSNSTDPTETVEQFTVGSQGGNFSAFGSTLDLNIPDGALGTQQTISVKRATPSNSSFIPGTAFDLGPTGLTFLKSIQLKTSYDSSKIPGGHSESDLSLARLENGKWTTLGASGVNETYDEVCGLTSSFSTYAVVVNTTKVSINGPNYAYPNGRTELTFSFPSPMPQDVIAYRATWSESSNNGFLWVTTNEGGGTAYAYVDVLYINGAPEDGSRVYFQPFDDAPLSTSATVRLNMTITFDFTLSGKYYHYGQASTLIEINYPIAEIFPDEGDCAPGDQVILTPDVARTPSGFIPSWHWDTDGANGLLWEAGKDPESTPGVSTISKSNASYVIFKANHDAQGGAVEHVTLQVWVNHPQSGIMAVGQGRSNITIKDKAVSIELGYPAMIEVRKQEAASLEAVTSGAPAGDKIYVWNTTGNFGGFGQDWPSTQMSYQSSSRYAYYSGNGLGADGDQDRITVSVYLVQGSEWQLLGNASAYVEVYFPQTMYYVLDQDKSTGFMASGSQWNMYSVGHGYIAGTSGFYARQGDTLRIVCHDRGAEGEDLKSIYLWNGDNSLLLVPAGEIVSGMDRTFTISI